MSQVHRFGDCVAVFLGTGQTLYFTPKEAGEIAQALSKTKRDIMAHKFTDSRCGTFHLPEPHDTIYKALPVYKPERKLREG